MISFSKFYEDKFRAINPAYSSNKGSIGSNNVKTFPDDVNRALMCNYGTLETVQRFISNGANVNEVNSAGLTALHIAALKCEVKGGAVIELLLKNGADILAIANFKGGVKRPIDLISLSWLQSQIINMKYKALSSQEDLNFLSQLAKAVNYLDMNKAERANNDKNEKINSLITTFKESLENILKLHNDQDIPLMEWKSIYKVNLEELDFTKKCFIKEVVKEEGDHYLMGESSSENSE
jgi:ankyrin repeat protein